MSQPTNSLRDGATDASDKIVFDALLHVIRKNQTEFNNIVKKQWEEDLTTNPDLSAEINGGYTALAKWLGQVQQEQVQQSAPRTISSQQLNAPLVSMTSTPQTQVLRDSLVPSSRLVEQSTPSQSSRLAQSSSRINTLSLQTPQTQNTLRKSTLSPLEPQTPSQGSLRTSTLPLVEPQTPSQGSLRTSTLPLTQQTPSQGSLRTSTLPLTQQTSSQGSLRTSTLPLSQLQTPSQGSLRTGTLPLQSSSLNNYSSPLTVTPKTRQETPYPSGQISLTPLFPEQPQLSQTLVNQSSGLGQRLAMDSRLSSRS